MASDILVSKTLNGGFWPSSRFILDVEDEFMDDGTIREEYAEDAPFVGQTQSSSPIILCWSRCICWILYCNAFYRWQFALILGCSSGYQPSPDLGHYNQIQVHYWMPNLF